MAAVPGSIICLAFGGGNHILCHLIHFGINLWAFAGEGISRTVGKGNDTAVDLHADIDGPEFLHALELSICIRLFALLCTACIGIACLKLPCADRKRSKHSFACQIVGTGARNGNCCNIFVILNAVFSSEACGNIHMIKLPLAHVVQVDIDGD